MSEIELLLPLLLKLVEILLDLGLTMDYEGMSSFG